MAIRFLEFPWKYKEIIRGGLVMAEQIGQEFTKKITVLPDGRQLIYYTFAPEAGSAAATTPPQPEKEGR